MKKTTLYLILAPLMFSVASCGGNTLNPSVEEYLNSVNNNSEVANSENHSSQHDSSQHDSSQIVSSQTETQSNEENNTVELNLEEEIVIDGTLLEKNGYSFTIYSGDFFNRSLRTTETSLNAPRDSITAIIDASVEKSGNHIYIYYFKKASDAKECYDTYWSNDELYHVLENRLYKDESGGNFFENPTTEHNSDHVVEDNSSSEQTSSNTGLDDEDALEAIMDADYAHIYERRDYYVSREYGEYNTYLNSYAPSIGIEREDIYGILSANPKSYGTNIYIYYFKTESLAHYYHNKLWANDEAYSVSGIRVICDYDGIGILD